MDGPSVQDGRLVWKYPVPSAQRSTPIALKDLPGRQSAARPEPPTSTDKTKRTDDLPKHSIQTSHTPSLDYTRNFNAQYVKKNWQEAHGSIIAQASVASPYPELRSETRTLTQDAMCSLIFGKKKIRDVETQPARARAQGEGRAGSPEGRRERCASGTA